MSATSLQSTVSEAAREAPRHPRRSAVAIIMMVAARNAGQRINGWALVPGIFSTS